MKTVNSNKLGLGLWMLFSLIALVPAAQAVPPGGAQYGVGIPTPNGPRTPDGTQRFENRNLSEPAREALTQLAGASPAERRQLQIVGSSRQLGAPPLAAPGASGTMAYGISRADLRPPESTGFMEAASRSLGGTAALLLILIAVAASFAAVILWRRRNQPPHPSATAGA